MAETADPWEAEYTYQIEVLTTAGGQETLQTFDSSPFFNLEEMQREALKYWNGKVSDFGRQDISRGEIKLIWNGNPKKYMHLVYTSQQT